ncbi:hypothetical protein ARAM_004716 [Aspergillus rambellii]|uniref:DUF4470 domain-containing protein n=3 Tax=Aspergillus subgen. Nidulantes TaxID=2720870 RepID=A0A0F8XMI1_9EURO|nr:hypothetical protein AOCH_002329 [Aspergillus ochraceoroseus]KKK24722.1 hypothetical protein ARAM_004716 [Aspergillus rambellii]
MAEQFGAKKYLWGNVPAFDILRLGSNEGAEYGRGVSILCAASGDIRNIVNTIAQLPTSYRHSLRLVINDRDFDIVARNIILLLIALVVEEVDEAVDCMIHLWYSAFVRKSDTEIIRGQVRPLIESVCEKVKNKPPQTLLGKTWQFGRQSLRVVLQKSSWDRLLALFDAPSGLTAERAHQIRTAITLAESRRDYRERHMCFQSPPHRVAFERFRADGLLLPFGYPRHEFQEPNLSFFQNAHHTWPMPDSADPLHGWPSEDVANTSSGAATADIYGKLFFYLQGTLRTFLDRLSSLDVSFRLFQVDASDLPQYVEKDSFSRIEVSNISDAGWLGIHRTLYLMVPLLETPLDNPHATLITLFMNAVEETLTGQDKIHILTADRIAKERLLKYLPPKPGLAFKYSPWILKLTAGQDLVTTYDHIFDRYSKWFMFSEAPLFEAAMKENHTVIDKWPYRLKRRPGQPGAQEEFDRQLGSGVSSKERYMEWRRLYQTSMV